MPDKTSFTKIVNKISKEDFITLYPSLVSGKWFSEKELEAFPFEKSASSLAGRYLIKKAVADQLGHEFDKSEIEILNNEFGKPDIFIGRNLREKLEKAGIIKIWCSISHSRSIIAGMTILSF
jgi:phosphopantetheine--protein transferase-like protein